MSEVRRYAAAGLDAAARRSRRLRMTVGALDETGQEKHGAGTAGVKRQYMGCAGRVASGINTVHLSYVREKTGHALIGARQWIPAEDIADPVKSLLTALPPGLRFRTKGQLAIDVLAGAYDDGLAFDFVCGDEVYGSCTQLREFLEDRGQAYVLRVASSFVSALAPGVKVTCADAVKKLLQGRRGWEVRSAGQRVEGRALVRVGLARDRLAVPQPAGPPPPENRRARLPLLLCPRRPAGVQGPADQGSRAALASRGKLRARQGLLRPGPVPGPPLHRGPAAHRPGHGRLRDLRRHRRPATRPHRHPGPAACRAGRRAAGRPRPHPAVSPRDQATARRRAQPSATTRPRSPMAPMATPPPGTITLVPQTRTPATQLRPGQLAIGRCRTRPQQQQQEGVFQWICTSAAQVKLPLRKCSP